MGYIAEGIPEILLRVKWRWMIVCRAGCLSQSLGNTHDIIRFSFEVTQVGIVHVGSGTFIDFGL
jgi:hypothetical protein